MDEPLRATPLRYSAPSTARFVILILALVCNGLFVGGALHNVIEGDRWVEEVADCDFRAEGQDLLERQRDYELCAAAAERLRTVYSLAGGAASLLCGLAVAVAAPAVIRRRRGLKMLPAQLDAATQRVESLALEAHVRTAPELLIGRLSQRDAFTFGLPGAYRIALPPKLALKATDRAVFDPILLHELAHVSRHDVGLAWLARGIWLAVLPLAGVPVVVAIADDDLSIIPDYAWRAVVILVIVRLVANEVLRVREYEADVSVGAHAGRFPDMLALLSALAAKASSTAMAPMRDSGARSAAPGGASQLWHRLAAQHPSAARRVQVLQDPTAMLQPTMIEGFTAALLAATVQPLLQALLTTALTGTGSVALSIPIAAVLTGTLLGGSVGVGLWRASVYCRVSQRRVLVRGLGLAVGSGLALGQLLSFAQISVIPSIPGVLISVMIWLGAGMGATALVAGIGSTWADLSSRISEARWHRLMALVASTLVFALAVAGAAFVSAVLRSGGWNLVFAALTTGQAGFIAGVLALGLVVAIPILFVGVGRPVPGWVAQSSQTWLWPVPLHRGIARVLIPGIAAGLGGAVVIGIFRAVAGPPQSDADSLTRFFDYALVAAAAGIVAVLILAAVRGPRGAAASLLALPVAATTTLTGFVVVNAALGGVFPPDVLLQFLATALTAGTVGGLPAAAIALVSPSAEPAAVPIRVDDRQSDHRQSAAVPAVPQPSSGPATPTRRWREVVVLSVAAFGLAALLGAPIPAFKLSAGGSVPLLETSAEVSAELYLQAVVPPLKQGFADLLGAETAMTTGAPESPGAAAQRIREEMLPILEELQITAADYQPPTSELRAIHAAAQDAIQAFRSGYTGLADAYETSDLEASDKAVAVIRVGVGDLQDWLAYIASLGG